VYYSYIIQFAVESRANDDDVDSLSHSLRTIVSIDVNMPCADIELRADMPELIQNTDSGTSVFGIMLKLK
jgi:hypothetical protein